MSKLSCVRGSAAEPRLQKTALRLASGTEGPAVFSSVLDLLVRPSSATDAMVLGPLRSRTTSCVT